MHFEQMVICTSSRNHIQGLCFVPVVLELTLMADTTSHTSYSDQMRGLQEMSSTQSQSYKNVVILFGHQAKFTLS